MLGSPAACSGAMYAGVPIDVPICVSVAPGAGVRDALIALAMPKSVTTADAAGEQHVVGLDVAVHDAALVRVGERLRDVAQDARSTSAIGSGPRAEPRAQRLALDERHRVVRQAVDLAGREHRHDVRMLEPPRAGSRARTARR